MTLSGDLRQVIMGTNLETRLMKPTECRSFPNYSSFPLAVSKTQVDLRKYPSGFQQNREFIIHKAISTLCAPSEIILCSLNH